MHLMTEIGEASAMIGGRQYLVRPSFRALAALGDIECINQHIADVCHAYAILVEGNKTPPPLLIAACANVLESCSELPASWLGQCDVSPITRRMNYRQGKIRIDEVIIMAHHCIKWGVSGDSKWTQKSDKQERLKPFDPSEFTAILMDEFHMGREDAWSATMTEFQRLCEHRQRKAWGNKPPPPTKEEAQASFDYARDAIKRARELGIKPKARGKRK